MKNFVGTEWEHLNESEIFNLHQKYVITTIKRQFPNHTQFCKVHMIEIDDLIQMGNIGLLNAIRTYRPESNVKFQSYAISNIIWEITSQSKMESLRNVNNRTFEIVNVVSADAEINQGQSDDKELNILSSIASPQNEETSFIGNDNVLTEQILKFLEDDFEMTPDLLFIFKHLLQGECCATIAERLGTHRNTVAQRLRRNKALRIKQRLHEFLRDENLLNGAN